KDIKIMDSGVDLASIAERTEGYSIADVAKIIEDAALIAYRRCRRDGGSDGMITQSDLEEALSVSASTVETSDVLMLEGWRTEKVPIKGNVEERQEHLVGYY
ncbi:MAG: hypothetical protein II855_03025, partial [Candidatus Methanomethylophilaceae archaeon]|nr:hypothetical protein [Candidatus Methanomethylophilaceae archaeon]